IGPGISGWGRFSFFAAISCGVLWPRGSHQAAILDPNPRHEWRWNISLTVSSYPRDSCEGETISGNAVADLLRSFAPDGSVSHAGLFSGPRSPGARFCHLW